MMRRKLFDRLIWAVWVSAASAFFVSGAMAQSSGSDVPDSAAASVPASSVDDATLDKFTVAFLAVQKIQRESLDQQNAPQDPDAAKRREAEMQSRMAAAIRECGLQVEQFNQIAQLMLQDQELHARVAAKLQQKDVQGG